MVDIPIATVGGVINTQHGEVIAILHQYAYTGVGTSIHSPAQPEWYKNDVNDKSIKFGGLQHITTLEGLSYLSTLFKDSLEWLSVPSLTKNGKICPMSLSQVSLIGILANWMLP